ncbi:hypothetical protein Tsubulata_035165 [Turnera subulata]|uniref:Uncharacterized protein n=1 Tax=Turnera subulata TaxID=218843 RepID=A0A9Q0JPG4_9ROSI|nr:hypothetical protein Tsubulata_035165 [Turnera subulata]
MTSANSPSQWLHRLEGHTSAVRALAKCPSSRNLLASACESQTNPGLPLPEVDSGTSEKAGSRCSHSPSRSLSSSCREGSSRSLERAPPSASRTAHDLAHTPSLEDLINQNTKAKSSAIRPSSPGRVTRVGSKRGIPPAAPSSYKKVRFDLDFPSSNKGKGVALGSRPLKGSSSVPSHLVDLELSQDSLSRRFVSSDSVPDLDKLSLTGLVSVLDNPANADQADKALSAFCTKTFRECPILHKRYQGVSGEVFSSQASMIFQLALQSYAMENYNGDLCRKGKEAEQKAAILVEKNRTLELTIKEERKLSGVRLSKAESDLKESLDEQKRHGTIVEFESHIPGYILRVTEKHRRQVQEKYPDDSASYLQDDVIHPPLEDEEETVSGDDIDDGAEDTVVDDLPENGAWSSPLSIAGAVLPCSCQLNSVGEVREDGEVSPPVAATASEDN